MNTVGDSENFQSGSGKVGSGLAVMVAIVIGALFLVGCVSNDGGGQDTSTSSTTLAAASTSEQDGAEEDAPDDDSTAVEETDETGADDSSTGDDSSPVPTVVIGQDEDGNDIVVEIEVTTGCAQTFHEPLDEDSFSFIRWTYDAPGLEPGLPVRVSNAAGFEHFTVVTPDRKIVVEQGITSYGDYPFPSVEWNESDDSSVSLEPYENHTVDDSEGEASETCLETEA